MSEVAITKIRTVVQCEKCGLFFKPSLGHNCRKRGKGMTREEAIARIQEHRLIHKNKEPRAIHISEALDMAIEALEQEPKSEWQKDHEILKAYSDGANGVLDELRAEIAEEKEHAYADFERYKVEYLGQDWEDALDSLPQDDFRYGMERCIDIIDKYKAGSEGKE